MYCFNFPRDLLSVISGSLKQMDGSLVGIRSNLRKFWDNIKGETSYYIRDWDEP